MSKNPQTSRVLARLWRGTWLLLAALSVTATSPAAEPNRLIIEAHSTTPLVPAFFSATAEQTVRVDADEITGEARVRIRLVQGRPEVITLGLSGDGEVVDVSAPWIRDWAVRHAVGAGQRLLDVRPTLPAAGAPIPELELTVRTRLREPALPGTTALVLVTAGEAVGFSSKVVVQPNPSVDVRVVSSADLTTGREPLQYLVTTGGRLEVLLAARGALSANAELVDAQLAGTINEATRSAAFRLRGTVRATKADARLRLLTGGAALDTTLAGDGWHAELIKLTDGALVYDLVAERAGTLPVDLTFVAPLRETGDWRAVEFTMPAGAVVPLTLEGLSRDVSFKSNASVVPEPVTPTAQAIPRWQGFLPANGIVTFAWKRTREKTEAALAFTSMERTEVRLGAGLLRQTTYMSFRVLQGKLITARLKLEGPGEIIGVEGESVLGWKVLPGEGSTRVLEVRLSRPIETERPLLIQSQMELGAWPVRAEPLRVTPEGGVRHSGFVRIANSGAVRLEIVDASGMMQLAPTQWPGFETVADARQVFVYRFPSANYSYRVVATQIQPEVSVSAIATYELGETARIINASIELDVREAPLREFTFRIPEGYAVVTLSGSDVADHVAESASENGFRTVRVLFARPIEGRQLLHVHAEANQPAAAGDWTLRALQFPGAKAVRGHVGAVATPGFRLVPTRVERLVEVPLNLFPRPTNGLQQAWRVREPDWTAEVRVEALGQSVQADAFHLITLKEGVVSSSVLLNYFVVGAPASEWRVTVPAGVGNIDVVGQNVRRDWRRDGDDIVVTLHQPVLGAATLLITFDQPLSARGGILQPGAVRPVGVAAERGYVQVVSAKQVKRTVQRAEGALLKLEPLELPAEYRTFTSAPSLLAYQYTARPFALEVAVESYAAGETVEQVVDFAKLSTQVSRDGQVVTEAQFFVKTRGRKALRLTLPTGTKLWEARVDHELVSARADGAQTLIPLPARANPNEPVVVALRLGQPADGSDGSRITLAAPRIIEASTVMSEWTVHADSGRLLVPRGGNAELTQIPLTETGFEWIGARGGYGVLGWFGLVLAGVWATRRARRALGIGVCLLAVAFSLFLTTSAAVNRRPNLPELSVATTVLAAGENVTLTADNVPEWRALLAPWGLAAGGLGVALLLFGQRRVRHATYVSSIWFHPLTGAAGAALVAAGLLAQHGGAPLFFFTMGGLLLLRILVPAISAWRDERRNARPDDPPPAREPGTGAAGALPLLAVAALLGAVLNGGVIDVHAQTKSSKGSATKKANAAASTPARPAAPAPAITLPAPSPRLPASEGTAPLAALRSFTQRWSIREQRLFAEAEITVRGNVGESFLLLRAPAVLTNFTGAGLRVAKIERDGHTDYYLVPEREGVLTANVHFELTLAERAQPIFLPTGPAALQRLTIELDQGGWEFISAQAAQITPTPNLPENRSGATLVLAPGADAAIQLVPKRRDASAQATHFFAEGAHLFIPGPGVVNGVSRVTVRPVQGRISSLELDVPKDLTVGEVTRGPVGAWRFDPVTRRLSVTVEPAQTDAFHFDIETQLGAGDLPFPLTLEPLRVRGASGDVGMLALAFGADAQPEALKTDDVSTVNLQDFDAQLLPRTPNGQPTATLQGVWRYGLTGGRVELKVAAVAPDVRVTGTQVLSLDDDRLVLATDLRVAITRVGIFKLSFALPSGLEVEALTGPALSQWTEAQDSGQRIVTLHLNGRTIGEQTFNLTLVGPAPGAQSSWEFPRLRVREASRQTGTAIIVPGKGIRLRAAERERVTQLDPRTVGGNQPGSLAFRLLQDDWVLRLGIERLEAWITVQALHEVTAREGQTLTRLGLKYRVENAAVKSVQIRFPDLTDEAARTVRAGGAAVSDIVRVPATGTAASDLWEIRFQRSVTGDTEAQVEFQTVAERAGGIETIAPPEFIGARQTTLFVAVRGGGRLELAASELPRGWSRTDWSSVPGALQNRTDRSVPALCFRVAEPEGALKVAVRRHEVAEALKLRAKQADLLTLLAPTGAALTAVELKVDVLEKGTLRVHLPAGARLFSTVVNGESVSAVRNGDAWLFHVTPHTPGGRDAAVRLVYAATPTTRDAAALAGPSLSVPLENVTWRVVLPPGYDLDGYRGALRLQDERYGSAFSVSDYLSVVSSKRATETKAAVAQLQLANSWMASGDQEKAAEVLNRVSNGNLLDQAANEDARVQLRNLKTQQAVLGLNTRRQRLYLDNRNAAASNDLIEQAASLNPFMSGKINFDPRQVDQLLAGNTGDENVALRTIAAKIVDQQLGAEPAPGAIDVTLPERGKVFTFTRSLQVDGGSPLALTLDIERISRTPWLMGCLLLLSVGAVALLANRRSAPVHT